MNDATRVLPPIICLLAIGAYAQIAKPHLQIETGTHTTAVRRIDLDAGERFLVSASDDKTARVWDLHSGKLLQILRPPIGNGQEGRLYAVAISPDGETVAVGGFTAPPGSDSFPIYIFDRVSGAIRKTTEGLPQPTTHLAYSRNGRFLAAGLHGANGIRIFETANYTEVANDKDYADSCYWVEFDRPGRFVTTSDDGFLRVYDRNFHLRRKRKPAGGTNPRSPRFSPDHKRIAVGFNGAMAVEIVSGRRLSHEYQLQTPANGTDLAVAVWSSTGRTVCAGGRYTLDDVDQIVCWDKRGKGKRTSFPVAGNTILDLRALRGGAIAFSAYDGAVGVVDPGGTVLWRAAPSLLDFRQGASSLLLSADGATVATGSNYFTGIAWERHNIGFSIAERKITVNADTASLSNPATVGLPIERWKNDEHPTLAGQALQLADYETSRSLAITPDHDSFVLGTDWYLRRFDQQGKPLWTTSVPGAAWEVNLSANRRWVVAALNDGTLRWYSFDKGAEVLALLIDRELQRWVAWNPEGFFDFQNGGDALIGYQIDRGPGREGGFVKVDQTRQSFYQPELIAQILKPSGTGALILEPGFARLLLAF